MSRSGLRQNPPHFTGGARGFGRNPLEPGLAPLWASFAPAARGPRSRPRASPRSTTAQESSEGERDFLLVQPPFAERQVPVQEVELVAGVMDLGLQTSGAPISSWSRVRGPGQPAPGRDPERLGVGTGTRLGACRHFRIGRQAAALEARRLGPTQRVVAPAGARPGPPGQGVRRPPGALALAVGLREGGVEPLAPLPPLDVPIVPERLEDPLPCPHLGVMIAPEAGQLGVELPDATGQLVPKARRLGRLLPRLLQRPGEPFTLVELTALGLPSGGFVLVEPRLEAVTLLGEGLDVPARLLALDSEHLDLPMEGLGIVGARERGG